MIISTKYSELVRFLHPHLTKVDEIPMFDGFFLKKDLVNSDVRVLQEFSNFIVVSDYFFDEEWDQQKIVDYVVNKNNFRRKPKFDWMSEDEYIDSVKLLDVAGVWPVQEESETIFELYKNINSLKRIKIYFELRKTMHPYQILYSVITFIRRCYNENTKYEVSPGYLRIIDSKKSVILRNYKRSIKALVRSEADQDFKILNFIYMIGEV